MIIENVVELKEAHFEMLNRIFGVDKNVVLEMNTDELEDLIFSDNKLSLYDIMTNGFDDDDKPYPDTLLAEEIQDILYPSNIYNPQNDEYDNEAKTEREKKAAAV